MEYFLYHIPPAPNKILGEWKLLHPCDVIRCNTMNYLIRRQSERCIIIEIIEDTVIEGIKVTFGCAVTIFHI